MGAGKFNAVTLVCRERRRRVRHADRRRQAAFDNVTFRQRDRAAAPRPSSSAAGTAKFRACEFVSLERQRSGKVSGKATTVHALDVVDPRLRALRPARRGGRARHARRQRAPSRTTTPASTSTTRASTLSDTQVHRNRATGMRLSFATAGRRPQRVGRVQQARRRLLRQHVRCSCATRCMRNNGRAALKLIGDVVDGARRSSARSTTTPSASSSRSRPCSTSRATACFSNTGGDSRARERRRRASCCARSPRRCAATRSSPAPTAVSASTARATRTAPAGFSELLASVAANNTWAPEVSDYVVCDARTPRGPRRRNGGRRPAACAATAPTQCRRLQLHVAAVVVAMAWCVCHRMALHRRPRRVVVFTSNRRGARESKPKRLPQQSPRQWQQQQGQTTTTTTTHPRPPPPASQRQPSQRRWRSTKRTRPLKSTHAHRQERK
jgi:hypothetical protein